MTFTDALDALFASGHRVKRRAWLNPAIFCLLHNQRLCIQGYASEGDDPHVPHPMIVTESEYFADDWEVVE